MGGGFGVKLCGNVGSRGTGQCPNCTLSCGADGEVMRAGDAEIPGLTDEEKPRMRGPKRAARIRKLFNLTKEDDVRK